MNNTQIKDYLPTFIRRPLGWVRSILGRLAIWGSVARQIQGSSPSDRRILRRAVLSSPMTVLHQLNQWMDPVVNSDCRVKVRGIGVFDVRAQSDDLYHVLPSREAAVFDAIQNTLKPGDVFVDAGANIGFYSVLASQIVGPKGRVIAIEMMPDTASILRKHLEINNCHNVTVIEAALSDRQGQVVAAHVTDGKFGQASIVGNSGNRTVEITTTTLAHVLNGVPYVRLMKMDLEGAEPLALNGLGLAKDRVGAILFEDWGDNSISSSLAKDGFKVLRIDGNNSLATLT